MSPSHEEIPNKVLEVMSCHETWMSPEFLAEVTESPLEKVQAVLKKFLTKKDLKVHSEDESLFHLSKPDLRAEKLSSLKPDAKRELHAKIYRTLLKNPSTDKWEAWLAYHSALAEMEVPAFRWNVQMGEAWEGQDNLSQALAYYDCALEFARDDFKKAYALGLKARCLGRLGRYPEALPVHQEALACAERIPWPDFVLEFRIDLAQLLSHLGRYGQSEAHFRVALPYLKEKNFKAEYLRQYQSLGRVLIEEAKYTQAFDVFETCLQKYQQSGQDFNAQIAEISLAQIENLVGLTEKAGSRLQRIQNGLPPENFEFLNPFFKLLEGKFEITQGSMGSALRILEEAAVGFEKIGDINGKVEVLLSMSAPLLEHFLVQEAQEIIDLLSNWPELKTLPALEHSVKLRRLALATFAGKMREEDLALISEKAQEIGRREDWLQFWFHLALAGKKIGNQELFQLFIKHAQKLTEEISQGLSEENRESFLKRTDVARITRLSGGMGERLEPTIRAQRGSAKGSADSATLAPPEKSEKRKD